MKKMYSTLDAIVNDDEKTVDFNEKAYKVTDILYLYYDSENIKEKLTEDIKRDLDYMKENSIRNMKYRIGEFVEEMVVELAKIGFDSDEQLMQGINSVVNNDKTIHVINGKDIKLNDLIKYYMSDYIKDENTTEILYRLSNDMISFTNDLCEYIDSSDKVTMSTLRNVNHKIEDFANENEDSPMELFDIYEMTEKLLAHRYDIESSSDVCIEDIFETIVERSNNESEKGTTKIKQQQ